MERSAPPGAAELAAKIARLVEERGWNQEDFARIAQLNRQTVRQILQAVPTRKLRNATVSACARALGLTVSELRDLPLSRLLPRMHGHGPGPDEDLLRHLHEQATMPELLAWLERHPDRVRRLSAEDVDELLAAQGPGGLISKLGVERYVEVLERRRELLRKVQAIAGSEYLGFLEQFVDLLHEKVRPTE
jgi:transcriptional regulator with XRE-family HTH domain